MTVSGGQGPLHPEPSHTRRARPTPPADQLRMHRKWMRGQGGQWEAEGGRGLLHHSPGLRSKFASPKIHSLWLELQIPGTQPWGIQLSTAGGRA